MPDDRSDVHRVGTLVRSVLNQRVNVMYATQVDPATVVILLVAWVGIGGGVGALIGSSKGKAPVGLVLGLLLGIIGWVIAASSGCWPARAYRGSVSMTSGTPAPPCCSSRASLRE
jgi:hypothetical protein